MKWSEVRERYPQKFVKFEVIDYHTVDNKRYVDDVAIIKVIGGEKEALKEFKNLAGEQPMKTNNVPGLGNILAVFGL